MVCSFHHRNEFNPATASIKIIYGEGAVPFRVWLAGEGEKQAAEEVPCDGCRGLPETLCLQFCRKKEDLKKILDEFLNSPCRKNDF
jgi:hypothetical protein